MPTGVQTSFLEVSAKFDIDPEFNMMNEMTADMQAETYFAPKQFALIEDQQAGSTGGPGGPAGGEESELDKEETALES